MKKLFISIFTTTAIFSTTVHAIQPVNFEDTPPYSETIYCPESVTCMKDGDLSSCTFKTDHPEYWSALYAPPEWVNAGEHKLYSAEAYRRSNSVQPAECIYGHYDTSSTRWIYLNSKKEAGLETLDEQTETKWEFVTSNIPDLGECQSTDPQLCPLTQHSALIIHNINLRNGVLAAANGVHLIDLPIESGDYRKEYGKVSYDNALAGCGNVETCKIDIISPQGAVYGDVTVNMKYHMKIISVHSWNPLEVQINQVDPFNTIEISYPDSRRHQ